MVFISNFVIEYFHILFFFFFCIASCSVYSLQMYCPLLLLILQRHYLTCPLQQPDLLRSIPPSWPLREQAFLESILKGKKM